MTKHTVELEGGTMVEIKTVPSTDGSNRHYLSITGHLERTLVLRELDLYRLMGALNAHVLELREVGAI